MAKKKSNSASAGPPATIVEVTREIPQGNGAASMGTRVRSNRATDAQEPVAAAATDAAAAETTTPEAAATTTAENAQQKKSKKIKLYKSSRLKGYMTLLLASVINYQAAQKSSNVIGSTAVPAKESDRKYAVSVAVLSLLTSAGVLLIHLDRFTPLETMFWIPAFSTGSRFELCLVTALVLWWSIAVGLETSVAGIAGDGKGQDSLYYSCWTCCLCSFWILERWWVAAGYASFKSFITSWPYRAPGWICIMFLSIFTFIWYLDLWQNHSSLGYREEDVVLFRHFDSVPVPEYQWLISVAVFTCAPAAMFVFVEILRKTKPDGSNEEKGRVENILEGVCLLLLVLAWIPTVMVATTPGGAASLTGNAYFFSWILVIFVAETGVWFVHDLRQALHITLQERHLEYQNKQREVLERSQAIQEERRRQEQERAVDIDDDDDDDSEEYEDIERLDLDDSDEFR